MSDSIRRLRSAALIACGLACALSSAVAQDSSAADDLKRAQSLIEALAQRGLLPRARADALLSDARKRAAAAGVDAEPPAPQAAATRSREAEREALRREVREEVRAEVRDEVLAQADALVRRGTERVPAPTTASSAPAPVASATAPVAAASPPAAPAAPVVAPAAPAAPANVVRVQYVPQVVRDSIRNEIKEEVIAQMRAEAWGSGPPSHSVPEWVDRIRIDGDVRVRVQADRPDSANPTPEEFLAASQSGLTRAPDFAAGTSAGLATANTLESRERLRLRARLGVTARVSDNVSAGLRLTTGAATDRVSMNQTLGSNFNRYQFLLDRAYVRYEPAALPGLVLTGGRMANPYFTFSDLQFSENLAFDGLAVSYRRKALGASTFEPFATAGWFPIRESAPPKRSRSLSGLQIGLDWTPSPTQRWRFGFAQYVYTGVEGEIDQDYDAVLGPGRSYGQYEYEAGLRQRGNTLFLTNSPLEQAAGLTPDKYRWGLASRMRPQALTFAAEWSALAPAIVMVSGEFVRNPGFDREEIRSRSGVTFTDGSATGFGLRVAVGAPEVRFRGDWQVAAAYRRVGSDAVLDGFTDSDLNFGGTNVAGYSLGVLWGLDRATTLGLRWLAGHTLDSPTVRPGVGDRFGAGILQLDLNARF